MQAARRNLLRTGLMCTGAAAAAGVSLPASAAVEPKSKIAREDWDIVLVGTAFVGICPVLTAKEKAAKVLLIAKIRRLACTPAYSSSRIAPTKLRLPHTDADATKVIYSTDMVEV